MLTKEEVMQKIQKGERLSVESQQDAKSILEATRELVKGDFLRSFENAHTMFLVIEKLIEDVDPISQYDELVEVIELLNNVPTFDTIAEFMAPGTTEESEVYRNLDEYLGLK